MSGGSSMDFDEDLERHCPDDYFCPITKEIMANPVVLISDGYTYEEAAIRQWFAAGRRNSPMTGKRVKSTNTVPNHALRGAINQYLSKYPEHRRQREMEKKTLLKIIELREQELLESQKKNICDQDDEMKHQKEQSNRNQKYLYGSIKPGQYKGDADVALKILNEYEPLQHNECKEYVEEIPGLDVKLFDYQRRGVSWMLSMEQNGNKYGIHGGLLCDEMGLGKTVQAIALMLIQKANTKTKDKTIILTPVTLTDQWISELHKIATKGLFKIVNYYGDDRKKISEADFKQSDIVISTIDTFNNSVKKHDDPIMKLPSGFFSRIIIDECPELSNRKKCKNITRFCDSRNIKKRWALSGTPISDDVAVDLSGQCAVIGMPFNTYFNALTGAAPRDGSKWNVTLALDFDNAECIDRVSNFLTGIMIRRTKSHVENNPDFPKFKPVKDRIIPITMSENEQRLYNGTITMVAKQQRLWSLRKVCNHPALVFPKQAEESIPSTKIVATIMTMQRIQQHHKGDKILLFSKFKKALGMIAKQLEQQQVRYQACVSGSTKDKRVRGLRKFMDKSGGYDILLATTDTAELGINLQCANHIIFMEPRFNGGAENQAIGRCWRLGQEKQVYVYRLITKGTVEERLRELMLKERRKNPNMVNLWSRKTLNDEEREYVITGKGYAVDSDDNVDEINRAMNQLRIENDDGKSEE